MDPVSSLQQLRALSSTDSRYEKLTVLASSLLGGRKELDLHDHIEWLRIYAMATSEQEIVELVNDCIARLDQ